MSGNPAYGDVSSSATRLATVMLSPRRWLLRGVAAFSATAVLALAIWLVLLARDLFPAGVGGAGDWAWPSDLTRRWRDVAALTPAVLALIALAAYLASLLKTLLAAVLDMQVDLRRVTQELDDLRGASGPDAQKEIRA